MSLASTITTLNAHFASGWGSTTPVAYDNVAFDVDLHPEFVSFSVSFGSQEQKSTGSPGHNFYRQKGIVSVRIFTPLDRGAKRGMQLADQISALFRTKTISGITFKSPSTTVVGQFDGSYQVNIAISFFYDETF